MPSSSWSTCSGGRPPQKSRVELSLKGKKIAKVAKVKVDCKQFEEKPKSIEEHDKEVGNDIVGYFTPDSPRYPVLDSIIRYKSADKTEVLAIQISIGSEHGHGPLEPMPSLLLSRPKGAQLQLALWDFPPDKRCTWKPEESADWELLHVGCEAFNKCMLGCL